MSASNYHRREMYFSLSDRDFWDLLARHSGRWFRLSLWADAGNLAAPPNPPKLLPRSAKLVAVTHSPMRRTWDLLFSDESFDPVPEGQMTPFGGFLQVEVSTEPTTEPMAKELDAATAAIQDLTLQLKGM